MSIIQSIRNKAWIIITAIAVALIAFIVQDRFIGGGGKGSMFGPDPTTLGKVNGTKIDVTDFESRYKIVEDNYKNRNYPINDATRNQIRENLWNSYVEDVILGKIYDDLGFDVNDKETGDILYGNNPPQELRQRFTDSTGQYNSDAAYQTISSWKKGSPEYANFWGQYVPAMQKNRLREKYTTLIGNSLYFPRWLVEKTNAENSQLSSISYVNVPYSSIPDSTIKISDDEVSQYVSEHKEQYKQEDTRTIQYVSFSAAPTKEDSAEIFKQVANLKQQYTETNDVPNFIISNNSEISFYDGYVLGSKMQMANADTIRKLPIGVVFGPYQDGSNYDLARVVEKRMLPDSIFCRHILIATGERGLPDSIAEKKIDSIIAVLNGGADFVKVMKEASDDKNASQAEGGIMKFSSTDVQNKENFDQDFAKFVFLDGKKGERKKVKTKFGYHYIEITDQKNIEEAYKVGYFSRPIVPSDNTINSANGLAAQFAAESRTLKQFNENADRKKLVKANGIEIKPLDNNVQGIDGENRQMVKWIYEAEKGDVSEQPFQVGDKFIVPVVLDIYKKGPMSVAKARPLVEGKIRNNKKAEQIIKKIGSATTMEAVIKATGSPAQRADSVKFNNPLIANVATEPKVVGAAFNTNYQSPKVSAPIKGESGVFVISVNAISAVANPNVDVKQQQVSMQKRQAGMIGYGLIEAMKKNANIKDYREKFF